MGEGGLSLIKKRNLITARVAFEYEHDTNA